MRVNAETKIIMLMGDPIDHSLSPEMHNTAYKAVGLEGVYDYRKKTVNTKTLVREMQEARRLNYRGVVSTHPNKEAVIPLLDDIDAIAHRIGAVNTVRNDDGKFKGFNTDWLGVVTPLELLTTLKGKKVVILGAGGAARAAVYGFTQAGSEVTIYNRTVQRAQELASEFDCSASSNDQLDQVRDADIIFNATSIGLVGTPEEHQTPLPKEFIKRNQIYFDAVYMPYKTRLLQEAEQVGAQVVTGLEMLLHQGTAQFEIFTGVKAPIDVMRDVLKKHIK